MEEERSIAIFQGDKIRKTWYNDEWWFSIYDIVATLTDSADTKQYIKKMRQRDSTLDIKWVQFVPPLNLLLPMGKKEKQTVLIPREHLD